MKKDCQIVKILDEDEKDMLYGLFDSIEKDIPKNGLIAEVKCGSSCPHLYSFGFSYYCCDQKTIKKHLEKNDSFRLK